MNRSPNLGIFNQKQLDDYAAFDKSQSYHPNTNNIFKKPPLTAQKIFSNNSIRPNYDQFKKFDK
jgi:hypothetical protein